MIFGNVDAFAVHLDFPEHLKSDGYFREGIINYIIGWQYVTRKAIGVTANTAIVFYERLLAELANVDLLEIESSDIDEGLASRLWNDGGLFQARREVFLVDHHFMDQGVFVCLINEKGRGYKIIATSSDEGVFESCQASIEELRRSVAEVIKAMNHELP